MATKPPFERVVEQHGPTVLRVCRALLGPHADADDAWSETFLSALTAWPGLPDDVNVEAWLVRVAHRKAIDVTRARKRRPLPVDPLPESVAAGPGDDEVALWAALRALPDKQRQCVAYHHLGGLPFAEVAAIVGGNAAAARRAAADGRAALRATLCDDERGRRARVRDDELGVGGRVQRRRLDANEDPEKGETKGRRR